MIVILDAGVLMNTSRPPPVEADVAIPQSVHDEIKSQQARNLLDALRGQVKVTVMQPDPKFQEMIRLEARAMGQNRLSPQDVDVLALALDLSRHGSVKILSDDYGVRNVAHQLKIASQGVTTTGGAQKRQYGYSCRACGANYLTEVAECDICGHTQLSRYRRS